MAENSGARSAQTPHQQLNVYAPTTLDIHVNEPRIAPERAAPANLLRLWFPESLQAYDAGDNLLWEHTFESQPSWRYVNESMGDMKGGRAIRKTLRSVETVDGLALIDCSVRWRGVDIDLDLTITNVGPMAWARVVTSTCLQRPAARDYLDADDTRTWLCSDEGFVSAAELAFPPRRDSLYGWVGEELPMKSGAREAADGTAGVRGLPSTGASCSATRGGRRGGCFWAPGAPAACTPTPSSGRSSRSARSGGRGSSSCRRARFRTPTAATAPGMTSWRWPKREAPVLRPRLRAPSRW